MKIVRVLTFFVFISTLFASIALAAPQKARMTSISGVVQDEKGTPAAGVIVETSYYAKPYSIATGPDGKFKIEMPQGTLRFREEKPDVPVLAHTKDRRMQAFRGYGAKDEEPMVLRPAREFAVTVNDASNHPVTGATVLVTAEYLQVAEATTDEAGKATVRTPANAALDHIIASKPQTGLDYMLFWRKDQAHSDPYRLEQDFKGPVTLTLNGMTKVSVHVTDEQGKALAGVRIHPWLLEKPRKGEIVNLSGTMYFQRVTDERGLAEFFIPTDNFYLVNFWAQLEGYSSLKRWLWDPKNNDKQVEVKLTKRLRIVGRVIDVDRKPAGGAWVSINGASYESEDGVYEGTYADDDGTFEALIDPDMYYMFLANKGEGASMPVLKMIQKDVTEPVEVTLEPGTLLQAVITGGPDLKPVAGASVQLTQDDGQSYLKLPKEQQFPVDPNGRKSMSLSASRHGTSDKNGIAEFYIAPGSYQLHVYGPAGSSSQGIGFDLSDDGKYTIKRYENGRRQEEKHVVADEKMQLAMHFNELNTVQPMLKGRVVLREKPDVGVADAILKGVSQDTYPEGASDREGKFSVIRGRGELHLHAVSADRKMNGIKLVAPGEDDVVVPIGPTASARGRIVDHEGKVMGGSSIEYGILISHAGSTFSYNFGGKATGTPDGWFTLDGLVPGFEYKINVATTFTSDGKPYSYSRAGVVKPAAAERIDLGDLRLVAPYRPKGAEDYAAEAFAKPETFEQRLAAASRRAKLSTQNVMLILGGPKSPAVMRFFIYRYDFRNAEFWNSMMDHWLIAVDTDRPSEALGAWADKNNVRLPGPGFVMLILDPDGKVIGQSTSDLLSTDRELDRRLVMDFAKKYAPAKPDGQKLFDEALAKAKAEGKKVLFDESGPYCGPCYQFSQYLEANKQLIEKEYVCVTLDYRFAGANEIFKRLKAATSTPWIAVLDSEAKVLATSDGPDGNVGFEKAQWEKMLRATAAKLNTEELKALLEKVKE